jgi:hypothetical protein
MKLVEDYDGKYVSRRLHGRAPACSLRTSRLQQEVQERHRHARSRQGPHSGSASGGQGAPREALREGIGRLSPRRN